MHSQNVDFGCIGILHPTQQVWSNALKYMYLSLKYHPQGLERAGIKLTTPKLQACCFTTATGASLKICTCIFKIDGRNMEDTILTKVEPMHEKTNDLHIGKQRRRSTVQ